MNADDEKKLREICGTLTHSQCALSAYALGRASLREEAAIAKLVREKMTSGNEITVARCTITSDELSRAIKE